MTEPKVIFLFFLALLLLLWEPSSIVSRRLGLCHPSVWHVWGHPYYFPFLPCRRVQLSFDHKAQEALEFV